MYYPNFIARISRIGWKKMCDLKKEYANPAILDPRLDTVCRSEILSNCWLSTSPSLFFNPFPNDKF